MEESNQDVNLNNNHQKQFDMMMEEVQKLWTDTNYIKCREKCLTAYSYSLNHHLSDKMYILYRIMGNLDYMTGDYSKALENYLNSQKLCHDINDLYAESNVLNNIGNVYMALEDFDKAIDYFNQSLDLKINMGFMNDSYQIYNNLGNVYLNKSRLYDNNQMKYYQSVSLDFFHKAISKLKENKESEDKYLPVLNSIGVLHYEMNNLTEAFYCLEKSKNIALISGNNKSLIHALENLAKCHSFNMNFDLALDYISQATVTAIKINARDKLRSIYLTTSEIYAKKNDFQNAYHYHLEYSKLSKELFSEQMKEQIVNMQTRFDMEKKEKELEIYRLKNIELANAYHEIENQKKELEILNNSKNEFLGIVVHDLRNPISNVQSLCELTEYKMKQNQLDIVSIMKNIILIKKVSDRMNSMVSDLLNISAIETGKIVLHFKEENFLAVIEEKEFFYQKLAEKKNINLIIKKESSNCMVRIDKERIQEVLDNLISNAVKFTNSGGEVQIDFEQNDKYLITNIRDNGQGLDEKELKELFKTYRKFSARPTAGESSTGFGLLIIKKVIDLHETQIWVTSHKDQGSTFSFSLKKV
ncbi:MAG TPA: ATP-binding protein [Candidatus Cloacimonadota bacterium]|nr:ATP-binding protein [Candidatus Cloacimonadota bacterium]HPM00957.1 ATP-binding protein [Candidatus Cloacimonadota bacterium]